MLVSLLVIVLSRHFGVAIPIIAAVADTQEELEPSSSVQQCRRMRTRYEIVWSCVATLFICTWVAIHPNVPPRGEGNLRALWRRIKLMLLMLIAPELVLIWAYRQWSAARFLTVYFQEEGWTPAHGHLLIMGGFIYVDGEEERVLNTIAFVKLLGLHGDPSEIAFPVITAEEIQDKARGDFLSKAIAILQSLWFIFQCIARGKQGLALTELEIVTLALASLNGAMYFFWWDKPLGMKEPIKLYRKGQDPPKIVIREGVSEYNRRLEVVRASSQRSLFQRLISLPPQKLQSSFRHLFLGVGATLSVCRASFVTFYRWWSSLSSSAIIQFFQNWRDELAHLPGNTYLWFVYLPIFSFIIYPVMGMFEAIFGVATSATLQEHATHVPTFYAPFLLSNDSDTLLSFVLPTITAIFGALHCIAWNFQFPSHFQQFLWRLASLATSCLPISLPFAFYSRLILNSPDLPSMAWRYYDRFFTPLSGKAKKILAATFVLLAVFVGILLYASLMAYIFARLLLLTQAVFLLEKQPDSAFYATRWADVLPHI